ncbi:MAG TPA: cell division protein ZapA [Nitrospirota bacterium]|jgi:cell division protein ZapA
MNSTEVDIFGSSYVVKGDADPEYVQEVARFVDQKMRQLAGKSPNAAGVHKVAVLAAINIADELFQLRRKQKKVDEAIRRKTGDLFDLLEG